MSLKRRFGQLRLVRDAIESSQEHHQIVGQGRVAEHTAQSVAQRIGWARLSDDVIAVTSLSRLLREGVHVALNDRSRELLRLVVREGV